MNKTITLLFLIISLLSVKQSEAQKNKKKYRKHGYTLTFTSLDKDFDPRLKARMIETFFIIYPKLVKEYNTEADKVVNFVIDTAYKGVAATGGGRIVYSPVYFKQNPKDIDVVTHEAMHVVQAYKGRSGPGWLTEGIADYVRYKFGVDNQGAGWSLPDFKPSHNYTNSYRITARFLAWLEKNESVGIVKKLDASMRSRTYSKDIWKNETGKTLDELWKAYSENPTI